MKKKQKNNKEIEGNVVLVAIIIVLMMIATGAIGWFAAKKIHSPKVQDQETQPAASVQPVSQANTTVKQKAEATDPTQPEPIDLALRTKFSLDILKFWGVKEVFQYPENPYKFYFISEDASGQNIWMFDASKDSNYLRDENPDIPKYNELLYNEEISRENEFRGVGFDGNKFVFAETSRENYPGPCFSAWQYPKLSYIEINTATISKKSYKVSPEKFEQSDVDIERCQRTL